MWGSDFIPQYFVYYKMNAQDSIKVQQVLSETDGIKSTQEKHWLYKVYT